VPAFNGKGNLLASWTPHKNGIKNRPTFIVVHGGHGIGGIDVATAMWARDELGANVLVLDSFWSRGRLENWSTWNEFGVNMRALDSIAAAKFVLAQGVDPASIYLMGGSQGGWTVLRTMTDTPFFNQYNKMFRAGISVYPNCITGGKYGRHYAPKLGPYNGIVVIFSAAEDTATPIDQCDKDVLTSATFWKHYPGATHGFDVPFFNKPNQNTDGECVRALNIYNRFLVCKNVAVTQDMRDNIKTMVRMLSPYPHLLEKHK
jgi:dienelactone hydrolase